MHKFVQFMPNFWDLFVNIVHLALPMPPPDSLYPPYLQMSIYWVLYTVCPGSSDPFHVVSYYIKWVTASWTYSIYCIWPSAEL